MAELAKYALDFAAAVTGGASQTPWEKPPYDIYAASELMERYNVEASGAEYQAAMQVGIPKRDAMVAKRAGDMVASLQLGMGLRYLTRIRAVAATVSRRKSIADADAEFWKLATKNVG